MSMILWRFGGVWLNGKEMFITAGIEAIKPYVR